MTAGAAAWITGYVGTAAELAGLCIGIWRWRKIALGQRLIALWLGASAASDLLQYYYAARTHNTQPIVHVWYLLTVLLGVEALATFQHSHRGAFVFRGVGVAYAAIWIVCSLTLESLAWYSTFSGPLVGIVLLGAAVVTLFRRVAIGRREFLSDPGFLIAVAVCAVSIPAAFQTVVAQLWLNAHQDMTDIYYSINNIVSALASLVVIVALRPIAGQWTARIP